MGSTAEPILHPNLVLREKAEPLPDPESLGLQEEFKGWHGYIEWENYPERKRKAEEFLKKFDFPAVGYSFLSPFDLVDLCMP